MHTVMINNSLGADIHTHILPGIDDGAENVEVSLKLIATEKEMGVTDIALTPHFHLSNVSLEKFLSERDESFKVLKEKLNETELFSDIKFYLGAEVRYDPNLIHIDIEKLCIGNTSYLLLEPTGVFPFNFENTLNFMLCRGITPILAHIERYDYILKDFSFLEKLIDSGVVMQCNASSVCGKHRSSTALKLIKKGYVDLIASDCHNTVSRPPMLSEAYNKLKKQSVNLINNSKNVINDRVI